MTPCVLIGVAPFYRLSQPLRAITKRHCCIIRAALLGLGETLKIPLGGGVKSPCTSAPNGKQKAPG